MDSNQVWEERRELLIKTIDFYGDILVAVKDDTTGKIYTGVSYVCKGIGLSKSQKDTQVQNVQSDLVLNRGCLKFQAGVIDPNNEVLGIELDFLPLWLAKITITPKMQEEQPQITEKLIQYQLKAKDVLAEAFFNKPSCLEDVLIQSLQAMKDMNNRINQVNHHALEAKAKAQETKEEIQDIRDVITLDHNSWREDCRKLISRIASILGGYQYIRDVNKEIYSLMDNRLSSRLSIRLTNKRRRMADEGISKSKRDKLTYVDVIADDKKLIEGYKAIVKEMAIKYGVA